MRQTVWARRRRLSALGLGGRHVGWAHENSRWKARASTNRHTSATLGERRRRGGGMLRMEALALALFIRVTCGAVRSTVPARSRPAQNLVRERSLHPHCPLPQYRWRLPLLGSHRLSHCVRGRVRCLFHSHTWSTTFGNNSARLDGCRRGDRSVYVL